MGPEKLPKLVGYLREENVEGGNAAPDGRTPLEGMQNMLVWIRIQKETVAGRARTIRILMPSCPDD